MARLAGPDPMADLRVERGSHPGRVYPLRPGEEVFLGRSKHCAIPIEEQNISRQHARIYFEDGRFYVADLGSRNGTAVNGKRVTAPTPLAPGDHIRIGRTWLSFSPEQASDPLKLLQSDYLVRSRCPSSYLLYQADQRHLSRAVALAVFPSAGRDEEVRERFLTMLRGRARLDHRNLQTLIDYGLKEEVGYYAAEWIEGATLARAIKNADGLEPLTVARIGAALAGALEQMHGQGSIHGGISTETIRLDGDRPVMTEIGLDVLTGDAHPRFCAPEGRGEAGDIYALAAVLAEALLGPAVNGDAGKRAAALRRACPPLAEPLGAALADDPAARPAAAELAAALRKAGDDLRAGAGPALGVARQVALTILSSRTACWVAFPAVTAVLLLIAGWILW